MIEWGKMWGRSSYDSHLEVIRVKNDVTDGVVSIANAFNGSLWIRRPLNSVIDPGVYTIEYDGGLSPARNYKGNYPDLELKMPDFSNMTMIKSFSLAELEELSFTLQRMEEMECEVVYLSKQGVFSSRWDWEDDDDDTPPIVALEKPEWFSKLPTKNEFSFRRSELQIAVNEMTYYQGQEVILMHPVDSELPLVFGVAPQACAVITEYRSNL